MKFNSQICTNKEQSLILLKLGLKPETADMCFFRSIDEDVENPYTRLVVDDYMLNALEDDDNIPAWSSARLLEMIPKSFREDDNLFYLNIYTDADFYDFEYESNVVDYEYDNYAGYDAELYEALIETIQILIQRGHFNKEYLKEG